MGTVSEWREVLIKGALWGGLMMLWKWFEPRAGGKDPALHLKLLLSAIAGIFYGLLVVFWFRAFRWPLVMITMTVLAACVLVGISYRKRIKRLQSNNPSISA